MFCESHRDHSLSIEKNTQNARIIILAIARIEKYKNLHAMILIARHNLETMYFVVPWHNRIYWTLVWQIHLIDAPKNITTIRIYLIGH